MKEIGPENGDPVAERLSQPAAPAAAGLEDHQAS